MKRRSFFKVLGSVVAAVSAPSLLAEPATLKIKKPKPFSVKTLPRFQILPMLREVVAYDATEDRMIVRYDIICGEEQIHVDSQHWIRPGAKSVDEWLDEVVVVAKEVLGNEIKHRTGEVRIVPLPVGDCYRARHIPCDEWRGFIRDELTV